jgi:probable HAF family extracellular repeat protein
VSVRLTGAPVVVTVGPDGGTLVLEEAQPGGGTRTFRLEVPAGAVPEPVDISLSRVASVDGLGLERPAAVSFGPDGLQLLRPARLTVAGGGSPFDAARDAVYLVSGDGARVEALPLTTEGGVATALVPHFSTAAVGAGPAGAGVPAYGREVARLRQELARRTPFPTQAELVALFIPAIRQDFAQGVRPLCAPAARSVAELRAFGSAFAGWAALLQQVLDAVPAVADLLREADACSAAGFLAEEARITARVRASGDYRDIAPLEGLLALRTGWPFDDEEAAPPFEGFLQRSAVRVVLTAALERDGDGVHLRGRAQLRVGEALQPPPPSLAVSFTLSGGLPTSGSVVPGADGAYAQDVVFDGGFLMGAHVTATLTDFPFLEAFESDTLRDRARLTGQVQGPGQPFAASTVVRPGQTATVQAAVTLGATQPVDATAVTFTLEGPGSLSAPEATTGGFGLAEVTYTPPPDTAESQTGRAVIRMRARVRAVDEVVTASAAVDVVDVDVAVTPGTATLAPGGTLQLSAAVTGTPDGAVTWSVDGGGSVSPAGLFTSSGEGGTFTVRARSVADPLASGAARITVTAACPDLAAARWTPRVLEAPGLFDVRGINGRGVFVARQPIDGRTFAVAVDAGGAVTPLYANGRPRDVNDARVAVGFERFQDTVDGVVVTTSRGWRSDGGAVSLLPVPEEMRGALEAKAVGNDGTVWGDADVEARVPGSTTTRQRRAFSLAPDGTATVYPGLSAETTRQVVVAANDTGTAVALDLTEEASRAVLLSGGQVTELGSDLGVAGVNDAGQVAGSAFFGSAQDCFVTTGAGGLSRIGGFNGGFCNAYGINDAGVVAGDAETSRNPETGQVEEHAFVWKPGGPLVDLNTRLTAPLPGIELESALVIGDDGCGTIVAGGVRTASATGVLVVLTPE